MRRRPARASAESANRRLSGTSRPGAQRRAQRKPGDMPGLTGYAASSKVSGRASLSVTTDQGAGVRALIGALAIRSLAVSDGAHCHNGCNNEGVAGRRWLARLCRNRRQTARSTVGERRPRQPPEPKVPRSNRGWRIELQPRLPRGNNSGNKRGRPAHCRQPHGKNHGADICALTTGASLLQEMRDGEQSNRVEHEKGTHRS
jgi:hypothetical protein